MKKLVRREETILEKQAQALAEIKERLREGKYHKEKPYLKLNPFLIAPLSLLLAFESEEECAYHIVVNGDFFFQEEAKTRNHAFILWGLKPDTDNVIKLSLEGKEDTLVHVRTEAIDNLVPLTLQGKGWGKVLFLPLDGYHYPQVYDENGEVRYLLSERVSHHFEPLENGHFLVGAPQRQLPPFESVDLWEMDFSGFVHKVIHLPSGASGGFTALDEETLVAITEASHQGTVADALIWLDRESGEVLKTIFLKTVLKMRRSDVPLQTGSDWCRAIEIKKDGQKRELYVITSHIPSVLVYDYEGNFLRGVIKESLAHLVWDVSKWRLIEDKKLLTLLEEKDQFFALVEVLASSPEEGYLALQSLTQGYQFNRLEEGKNFLALHQGAYGECKVAPFGDEACSSKRVCFSQKTYQSSYAFPLASYGSYQVEEGDFSFLCPLDQGEVLGQLSAQPELDVIFPITEEEGLDEAIGLNLWQDGERLYLRGEFYQGDAVVLELISETETKYYYLEASLTPKGRSWFGGQGKGPERTLHWILPLNALQGTYHVNLLVDEVRYHTDYQLEL